MPSWPLVGEAEKNDETCVVSVIWGERESGISGMEVLTTEPQRSVDLFHIYWDVLMFRYYILYVDISMREPGNVII